MRSRASLAALAVALIIGGVAAALTIASSHGHIRRTAGGRVAFGSFHSSALRGVDHYSVYLPRGYASSRRRYPVIYFLHNWSLWQQHAVGWVRAALSVAVKPR